MKINGKRLTMSGGTINFKSGVSVHWEPADRIHARINFPHHERVLVCRNCCELSNNKKEGSVGLIIAGICTNACSLPISEVEDLSGLFDEEEGADEVS